MIAKRDVAVIGGGPAGLTTALAFAMQGASVRVFEQAETLGDIGAGLQISPNGGRALAALGLTDALDRISLPSEAVVPTNGVTGRIVTRFDLTGQVPRYRFVARPDLIAMLAEACRARGVELCLGTRADDPRADLVVGADGIKSQLRARLNGADAPAFSGQVAWRAVVQAKAAPQARIWMMPGRHVVTYPLPGNRLNIVAVQERNDWAAEGWHHADTPQALRDAFADACPALHDILWAVETPLLWGLFRHPVAARWYDASHVLVGDAAHPTLPFLAQGANLALEDAVVLARCVARHGIADGLPRYQALRAERVTRAIAAADANAINYHLSGVRQRVAHLGLAALGRVAPGAFINRLDWLYGYDPAG
ncbi:monooxygenase [Loktanella sp. 3ANDIMAR09]|uniref:FAD-dependent monooxygenase n=1 Tax=Loktanella sp. 3ANDIMAR09 TaxID=1225657 RepID=UPI0006F544FA|nr:FAD-dependent monooxygenase [Loktanella sp. 3ANDIMAR09]KQI68484.1 monooxygenase [Loktanella sp. 3ANDIMAR09]